MSGGYQPLASYGPLSDIPVEEARFRADIKHEDLIQAGRFGAAYVRPAPGFQSLLYLHDGLRHRVLAFWQDQESIERFHREHRAELVELERINLPDSPWITGVDEFRSGIARRQLLGPRMSLAQTDLATPSPPTSVHVCDFAGVRDAAPLLDIFDDLIPTAASPELLQFRGFMFLSCCDFGGGNFSFYLGFREPEDQAGFRASDLYENFSRRVESVIQSQRATRTTTNGQLLGWTVRQID